MAKAHDSCPVCSQTLPRGRERQEIWDEHEKAIKRSDAAEEVAQYVWGAVDSINRYFGSEADEADLVRARENLRSAQARFKAAGRPEFPRV